MHLVIFFVPTSKALEKSLNIKMYLHLLKTDHQIYLLSPPAPVF